MAALGDELQRRGDLEGRETAVGFGCVLDEVAVEAQQVPGLVELVEEQPDVDVLDRVQLELERGDHPEVAAAASQRPEQVLVLPGAGRAHLAVGGDHLGREQVVETEAVAPGQVADPAAQGEPGDAGSGNDPTGGGQPVGVRGVVEVPPGGPASGAGRLGGWVDVHVPHQRQVDDHPAVVGTEAGGAVPAAFDRQVQAGVAGEVHCADRRPRPARLSRSLPGACRTCRCERPGPRRSPGPQRSGPAPAPLPAALDGRLGHIVLPLSPATTQRGADPAQPSQTGA